MTMSFVQCPSLKVLIIIVEFMIFKEGKPREINLLAFGIVSKEVLNWVSARPSIREA